MTNTLGAPRGDGRLRRLVDGVLAGSGVVSSVLYVAADVVGSRRYPGYRWSDQEFSELTAQGAPTRPLMIGLVEVPYNLLVLALAAGLRSTSGPKRRAARVSAAALAGYAAFGFLAGTVTPMTTREAMAAGRATTRNAFHGPLTLVSDLFLAGSMVSAGQVLGTPFRRYSYATVATLVAFGAVAARQIPRMAANQPTPRMGLEERVNIYASMLWVAVLSAGLLRAQRGDISAPPGAPALSAPMPPAARRPAED